MAASADVAVTLAASVLGSHDAHTAQQPHWHLGLQSTLQRWFGVAIGPRAFSYAFKEFSGVTPSAYRSAVLRC